MHELVCLQGWTLTARESKRATSSRLQRRHSTHLLSTTLSHFGWWLDCCFRFSGAVWQGSLHLQSSACETLTPSQIQAGRI